MEQFLELIRVKINDIFTFLNKLQQIIGLSSSTDNSLFGKINSLENTVNNIQIPKYYTEKLVIQDNFFLCTHNPIDGKCIYDEVTLYHPDGGTLIWEGISFTDNIGYLTNSGMEYTGWTVKVQYFYI